MIAAISNTAQSQPVAKAAPVSSQPTPAKSSAAPGGGGSDTVQLSATAQAVLAAGQEARETPAQTAKEANGGDRQAQRLMAKQAATRVPVR